MTGTARGKEEEEGISTTMESYWMTVSRSRTLLAMDHMLMIDSSSNVTPSNSLK